MAIVRDVNLKSRSVTLGQVAEDDLDSALLAILDGKLDATRIQTGTVDVTPTATESSVTVTFPTAFAAPPGIQLTPVLDGTGVSLRIWASNLTVSGFVLHAVLDSGTLDATSIHWLAM